MTETNVEVDMGSVMAYFAQIAIDEETAKKAYEAVGRGSSILLQKDTDIRTLRVPDIKPGQKYVSPYNELAQIGGEEITFPPRGFPQRFQVVPEYHHFAY